MRNQSKIKHIQAREILDSRGQPTLECEIILESGISGRDYVPSGASKGKYEALELRDGDKSRYQGKGVLLARENVKTKIARALLGKNVTEQKKIDQTMIELDGTENKSKLGANAILSVSLACARAAAHAKKQELYEYLCDLFAGPGCRRPMEFPKTLPTPMLNIINGGKHSDSGLDIQEFMIVPKAEKFSEKMRQASEIYQSLKEVVGRSGYQQGVGDEGGFAPRLETNFQAFELIEKALELSGYKLKKDIDLALDCAASEFYDEKEKKYILRRPYASLTPDQLFALYHEWRDKYPIVSIEDPFAENDWTAWKKMTERMGENLMIVGDDLFVTNMKRLETGLAEGVANAILIKPNQIGTLSETLDCIQLAKSSGFRVIVSHRSGETCDNFIADLAFAVEANFVKFGAPARGERVAKYNRLLKIENKIKDKLNLIPYV